MRKPGMGKTRRKAKSQVSAPLVLTGQLHQGAASGPAGASDQSQLWLTTFTDTVALMITFFVMLFAMSQVEERQWQNLVNALNPSLDKVRQVKVALPSETLNIETVTTLPGLDLDYLAPLLVQHMSADEELAGATVTDRGGRLVVSLPADLLFAPGATVLKGEGERLIFALVGLLRNLDNRVEVAGFADPRQPGGVYRSNWELSLVRALTVASLLERAGYGGGIVARGYGAGRFGESLGDLDPEERLARARRVDIIVHENAAELSP